MITRKYTKDTSPALLTKELKIAGFDLYGCSCDTIYTYVHLKDTETKDPASIVSAHVKPAEKTKKELYAAASNKLEFIAKQMGYLD